MSLTASLAYFTHDLPGIGGTIKQRQEDFIVEEQPAGDFTGEGEHLIVFVEKRGRTTLEVIRRLAKAFGVPKHHIGYAGMKDKHAVTRQHFSIHIPGMTEQRIASGIRKIGYHPQVNILWHDRHDRKIRKGYHGGNRFIIYIRDVQPTDILRAKPIFDKLVEQGVPNYIGDQRFGYRQNSHLLGKYLLTEDYQAFVNEMLGNPLPVDSPPVYKGRQAYEDGDYREALRQWPKQLRYDRQALDALRQGKDAKAAVMAIDPGQRDFLICGFQSAVFNAVLDRRVREATFAKLLPGDLAYKHDNSAVFAVDEAVAELENSPEGRVRERTVSPSGPTWGSGMAKPTGRVLQLESEVLEQFDIDPTLLESDRVSDGRRRMLRMFMQDADISSGMDEHGAYVRLAFELAGGCFATMCLREIMKTDMHAASLQTLNNTQAAET